MKNSLWFTYIRKCNDILVVVVNAFNPRTRDTKAGICVSLGTAYPTSSRPVRAAKWDPVSKAKHITQNPMTIKIWILSTHKIMICIMNLYILERTIFSITIFYSNVSIYVWHTQICTNSPISDTSKVTRKSYNIVIYNK